MSFFQDFEYETFVFDDNSYEIRNFTKVIVNDPSRAFNSAFLQDYYIQSGTRPDVVADVLYSDVRDWWTFFVINGITINEWPLDDAEFNEQIDNLLTQFEQQRIQAYETDDDVNVPPVIWNDLQLEDGTNLNHHRGYLVNRPLYTKSGLDNNFSSNWGGRRKDVYRDLYDLNESRRRIRVIQPRYLEEFKTDFRNRVTGTV